MNPVVIGDATRIYALCEFPSMVPRYVGKTVRPLFRRMASHMQVANRNPRLPVARWLAKAKREGRQVCIKWLETVPPGDDWQARERFWIAKHRTDGAALLNLTEGGEGLAGHRFTEVHRQRIAASVRTGAVFSCLACGGEFYRKRNQIDKGQNKYCCRACANKATKGGWECRSKK